jgi:hypothetical protein
MGPKNRKKFRICAPASSRWRPADLLRHVPTGGEVIGEDGLAQYDLRDMGCWLGGNVLDEQGRNTAGGEEGRRPRWRASVPGEGPANTGKQGTQEHRGEVRVRLPYPNWPRMWRKRVVDGEAVLGRLRRGTAWGRGNSS